jgi:DNA-binding response OmpR family regulator
MQANRVLCVEDDEDTRDMLKFKLGFSDLEVVVAPDADAALRLMEREHFSLYVLGGGLRNAGGCPRANRFAPRTYARPSSSSPATPPRPT